MAGENQAGPGYPRQPPGEGQAVPPPPAAAEAPQAAPPGVQAAQQPPPWPGGYYYAPYYGYAYQPPPRKKPSRWPIIIVVVIAGLILIGFMGMAMIAAALSGGGGGLALGGEQIGLVQISGMITGGGSGASLFGLTAGCDEVAGELKRAAQNSDIKAVILRIDSPGGSAAAAQEIYSAVNKYRDDTHKPVIASLGDVGASGAYYVAAAADKIVADPGTVTGSIGVIMEGYEAADLMKKYGVTANTIRSGQYKDTMSPFRHMRPDERQYLQQVIDDVLDQFITDVAAGRKMKKEEVRKLADGRIFTGRQAKQNKLVDDLGGLSKAVEMARKAAGLSPQARLVPLRVRRPLEELFGAFPYGGESRWDQYIALRKMSPATHLLEHPWLGPELQ